MSLLSRLFNTSQNRKSKTLTPIAKITQDELELLRNSRDSIKYLQTLLQLARTGYQTTWWQLRNKYQFGDNIDFDWSSGEVFEKTDG